VKYLILILAVTLTACGGSSGATDTNPFQQALGKPAVEQPSAPVPTDPFAPVVKKNGS
jgi:hypothetical protein